MQEHSGERHRQLRVLLFAEREGRPKIHEPAGVRLHVEKHLGTIGLIFGLAPFVRVRRKGHRELECAVDSAFAVVAHEPVESTAQELGRLPAASGPIGRIPDAEFDQDGCEARRGCIASERRMAKADLIESRNLQAVPRAQSARGHKPGRRLQGGPLPAVGIVL